MFKPHWSGLENDVASRTCVRPLGVIHTSPQISIRSPASGNQHSMLVLRDPSLMVDQVSPSSWFGHFQRWKVRGGLSNMRCSQETQDGGKIWKQTTLEEDLLLLLVSLSRYSNLYLLCLHNPKVFFSDFWMSQRSLKSLSSPKIS